MMNQKQKKKKPSELWKDENLGPRVKKNKN